FGDNAQAVAIADRAVGLAAQLAMPDPARALGFRGGARFALGDSGGLEDYRRALEAAAAQGLGRELAVQRSNLGFALGMIEGPRAMLETLQEAADVAERRGIVDMALAIGAELDPLVDLGSWDEAMASAESLVGRLEEAGDMFALVVLRWNQVKVLACRGEFEA